MLAAAADELVANGMADTTIAAIAERAQVSQRTVYRHFPDWQSLLDALTEWVESELTARMERTLPASADVSLDELLDTGRTLFTAMEDVGRPAEAMVLTAQANRLLSEGHRERTRAVERVIADGLPTVDPSTRRQVSAIVRLLFGSHTWYTLTRELGLTAEQAGEAVSRTARALLADARRTGETS
ncbi:TetR/AcrR family transcriptional regulator [Blastococcus sp. PRF04-17]|uniref:TetR/AcrR family transcriptional regulator n=1 Tax=Blastococcus sp. PRF04-17 TaxID=2933797 RepID=UPI001FF44222|nr:TetR/AcrR family transcriptional regulator [Blastococcus sp. PRF04-17]UOY01016.1 TetR/AcrR family transcriptional regulator [Blastococcus sp. PRF04-17]